MIGYKRAYQWAKCFWFSSEYFYAKTFSSMLVFELDWAAYIFGRGEGIIGASNYYMSQDTMNIHE